MERTFVMVKPDGVQRNLVGEVVRRFEGKGWRLVALRMLRVARVMAESHYQEHLGKPFYPGLVDYITSGPVVAMVWEGKGVVAGARKLIGATNPAEAAPGTIRGDYGVEVGRNVIHGADSAESAAREIGIYFQETDIHAYQKDLERWVYE
ncbi:MAG: nucleoside-diphosphate kinase [Syntrophomonadaceae bacterium]|nr:nucleoside-diphosphate kinase [Syntrophomonadaceae bacterium]